MKKIYLMAALAAFGVATASADKLTFYVAGTEVTPGETVKSSALESFWDEAEQFGDYTMDPKVTLKSDVAGSVDITTSCTTGQTIQLCAGGDCMSNTSVTKQGVAIAANTDLDLMLECKGWYESADEAVPEDVTVDVSAQYTGNAASEVKFVLVMNAKSNSVTVLAVDPEFRFNGTAIEYNVKGLTAAALYDLQGRCVLSANVSGNGTLDTTALAAGVYVYTLGEKTGKIYVK